METVAVLLPVATGLALIGFASVRGRRARTSEPTGPWRFLLICIGVALMLLGGLFWIAQNPGR